MSSKRKRPISPFTDVIPGSVGYPLLPVVIFFVLDLWLGSPTLLFYPLNLFGIVFIILGLLLTSWCFITTLKLPKEHILVNWGPWAYVRHPIYLAGLFINLSISVMLGTVLLLLQFIGYTLFEVFVDAPHEERKLKKVFPVQYEEYSKSVHSWIPIT